MKESTKYDNCLDVKASDEMNSLTKYLDLSEDEKMDCFDEDGVLLLKKISETCQKEEKFLMVDIEKFNTRSVSKIINKFNL